MLYAVDWDVNNRNSSLYTLNTTTGAATLIGSTTVARLIGLAESSSGTLYSVNESDVSATSSNLYTINPSTGAATLVGALGVAVAEGDLAFDPATGQLYVANALTDQLLRVNTTTGAATVVGNFGTPGRDVSGMTFTNGTAYGLALNDANPDTIVTINTTTGAATTVGQTGTSLGVLAALTHDSSSGLNYMGGPLSNFGTNTELYTVNLTTGAATPVTAITGVTFSLSGLAPIPAVTSVPEPASVIPLLTGALGLLGYGWRRRRQAQA
jgi:hypothetical protein